MLIDLLKRIASSSSAFLLETIKKSTSNENDRPATNSKRKLSFETLESRELLAATPFYIEETGMFSLTLIESEAVAQNAVYAYYADDIDGTIDGVTPDKLGTYLAKAQSRLIKQEPLSSSIPAAADQSSGKLNFELSEEFLGKYLAFYTVTTHHDWQDTYNYFFFDSGNVDKSVHFKGDLSSGTASGNLSLEDTPADKNPDWDYNDLVFTTQFVPGIRGSVGNESNNNSNNNNHNGGGGNDDSSCCGSEVCQCFSGNSFDNYDLLNSGDLLVFSDELVGESSNNPFRTIHSDFKLPSAGELPERVVATLQFADLDPITVYYDAQGFVNGDWVTFGIQVDVSSLDSGRYDWTMEIESRFSDGSTTSIIREGTQDVVNWLSNNETGKAWNISDIDRVQITGDGVNWLKGSGDSIWFTLNGDGTYTVEDGSETGTVLTNNNGLIIVTKKDNSKYYFNSAGFIVTKIDSMGNAVTYTYDSSDRLSTITSPDHHTTTYQYNAGGLLSSKTDFAGRSTIYGYDNLGRLVSVTLPDPDGSGELSAPVTTYEYLGNTSLISKITDPAGNTTIYTYNDMKSVIAVTRGDRTETFSGYGAAAVTDLSIAGYDSDHPAAFLAYSNKYGRRTDANGNSVWFSTDIFGNVNREIYSNNYEVEYIRNSSGQVTKKIETAPLGNGVYHVRNTEYLYDNSGNLLQLINPDGGIETWTYDSTFNQVTSYVDQLGRTTLYEIDSNTGLVLSVTEVVGNLDNAINRETDDIVTSYTYTSTPVTMNDPPAGLVETVTDALGFVTQFTYTMCGHVASITEAAGTSFEITAYYEYDSYSRKSAFIDPLGRRTEYLYDNLDNVIQIILPTDPNEPAQFYSYEYNSLNLISKSIDPNGAETTYTYDQDGNILTVGFFDPENTQQQTALILLENIYDANENLIFQYDSLRRFTNYTYNTLNQVTSILSGSLSVLPTVDLRIEYDGFGRVSRESGADGVVVTFVYDMMDRVLEVRR
ncbi:MAG: hypothetical protein LBJ00_05280, partial [Planctomycetaceae bacterium]|nr:hypothetical protein [Planctomycetaceae bacterium]